MFTIDLQVQIHVSDTRAPKVISMVGTMVNLVNEVLQSAVGNHFRNTLQALEAVQFIETRQAVQRAALEAVTQYLAAYEVETRGVYIQDVVFPEELVEVLTRREIANQERATFVEQQKAETARIETEKAKGTADMQSQLARSRRVGRHQRATRPRPARRRPAVKRPTCASPVRPRPTSCGPSAWPRPRPPRPSASPRPPATTPSARPSARCRRPSWPSPAPSARAASTSCRRSS